MTPSQSPVDPSNIKYDVAKKPPIPHRPFSDPKYLAPEDAFYAHSASHRKQRAESFLGLDGEIASANGGLPTTFGTTQRRRGKDRGRSGSRNGRGVWKKLLWVKQKDCTSDDIPGLLWLTAALRPR